MLQNVYAQRCLLPISLSMLNQASVLHCNETDTFKLASCLRNTVHSNSVVGGGARLGGKEGDARWDAH